MADHVPTGADTGTLSFSAAYLADHEGAGAEPRQRSFSAAYLADHASGTLTFGIYDFSAAYLADHYVHLIRSGWMLLLSRLLGGSQSLIAKS